MNGTTPRANPYQPFRPASFLAAVVPAEVAMVDVVFFRFITLAELGWSLAVASVVGLTVAYYSRGGVQQFFVYLGLGSLLTLLFLSCYTGVGWENAIVTTILDTIFRAMSPREHALVHEAIDQGTTSPAHASAYRSYEIANCAMRFCLLILALVLATFAIGYWRI